MVQTADGALEEVHDMLQRMNELCVQAANGTNSSSDRQKIQEKRLVTRSFMIQRESKLYISRMKLLLHSQLLEQQHGQMRNTTN